MLISDYSTEIQAHGVGANITGVVGEHITTHGEASVIFFFFVGAVCAYKARVGHYLALGHFVLGDEEEGVGVLDVLGAIRVAANTLGKVTECVGSGFVANFGVEEVIEELLVFQLLARVRMGDSESTVGRVSEEAQHYVELSFCSCSKGSAAAS